VKFKKRLFAAAGATTVFMGPGRKEFNPSQMPSFEDYLKETANLTLSHLQKPISIDEGVIGSFMASRFLKQANLPGFLPFMVPALEGKPCFGVEGACGTGGRAIGVAIRSLLAESAQTVFVAGFEIQNVVKSVYGADILAGAAYYNGERQKGHAFFFPGIFSDRAAAYSEKYGAEATRNAMARWYERAIQNARLNPKAQEFHNEAPDLLKLGMTPPDSQTFLPALNLYDCSKITDGAASLIIASAEGLQANGLSQEDAVEIVAIGEAEVDITAPPHDLTRLTTTEISVQRALAMAGLTIHDIALAEVHDCFSISGLLSLEAMGLCPAGGAITFETLPIPINPSGGLCGFGHPTGASGVRQLVDLLLQFTGKAASPQPLRSPYGMLISMGGNDKTVTALITRKV